MFPERSMWFIAMILERVELEFLYSLLQEGWQAWNWIKVWCWPAKALLLSGERSHCICNSPSSIQLYASVFWVAPRNLLLDRQCLLKSASRRNWTMRELQDMLYKKIMACSGRHLPIEGSTKCFLRWIMLVKERYLLPVLTRVHLDAQQWILEAKLCNLRSFPYFIILLCTTKSANSSPISRMLPEYSFLVQSYGYKVDCSWTYNTFVFTWVKFTWQQNVIYTIKDSVHIHTISLELNVALCHSVFPSAGIMHGFSMAPTGKITYFMNFFRITTFFFFWMVFWIG